MGFKIIKNDILNTEQYNPNQSYINTLKSIYENMIDKLENNTATEEEKMCMIKFNINWQYIQQNKDNIREGSIEEGGSNDTIKENLGEVSNIENNMDYFFLGWFMYNNISVS